jgi:7-cyano-7-deazaguanine synthase
VTAPRDLVLLSGGLDSSTLLADAVQAKTACLAVTVDYGQRHAREIAAAVMVVVHYGIELVVLDLTGWGQRLTGSALTDPSVDVPHGHYADESMRTTVVPNRNATLLSAAAGLAQARGCDRVLTAVHAGDHPIYPDCRPEFIDSIARTTELATDGAVTIAAPFVRWSKTDIARRAGELDVPIGLTWSCYEGGDVHCARCGTCVERIEALRDASVPDPTTYAAVSA